VDAARPRWDPPTADDRSVGTEGIKSLEDLLDPGPAGDRIIVHEGYEFRSALRRGDIAGIRQPGCFLYQVRQIGDGGESLATARARAWSGELSTTMMR